MDESRNIQIIELDSFDTAFPVDADNESMMKRRFMTLFAIEDEPARVGGTSYVRKVTSFTGESFALKRLMLSGTPPKGVVLAPEDSERITKSNIAAFREEYKSQLLVSRMRGFPRLYGFGTVEGEPAIIMEWVVGLSVREWARRMRHEGAKVPSRAIAALGVAVLQALDNAARLDSTLVHRDISPANIMIRTDSLDVETQTANEAFDICLIDFGSAALSQPDDPSFTLSTQAWRNGTPEYAAPEMLTCDAPNIKELRKSPSIDIFALCSVLYELYTESTPWQVATHRDISPYQLKLENPPIPIVTREPDDELLVQAIMSGLAIDQDKRPSVPELFKMLRSFLGIEQADLPSCTVEPGVDNSGSGIHLEMTPVHEGGQRVGEDVGTAAAPSSKSYITRRNFLAGALIVAAGAIVGGTVTWLGSGTRGFDFGAYPRADAPYADGTLYPAMHLANSSWVLRDASSSIEVPLPMLSREPGANRGNALRAYDETSGQYGYITVAETDGNLAAAWLILPGYADAGDFDDSASATDAAGAWLAPAKSNKGAWGYLGLDGTWAINPAFSDAACFSNGYAAVRPEGERLWGLIDASGSMVIPARFRTLGRCSEEGLVAALEPDGTEWGFINLDAHWTIPPQYRLVRRFTEGLAACLGKADGARWGYIAPDGTQLIEARYADARPFAGGLAPAQDAETGLWGLIDTTGGWKVHPQFLALGERAGDLFPAHGSPAGIYDIDGADAKAWEAYLETATDEVFGYGYIDESGSWVISPTYGDTLIRPSEA